jgi:hypothetical protein
MLIQAIKLVECLNNESIVPRIRTTIERILNIIENKGALPLIEDEEVNYKIIDPTFSNGIAGVIPLLCLAYETSWLDLADSNRLVNAALQLGGLVWQRGLFVKNSGLAHGVTGCGYAIHCIYRLLMKEARQESP